MPLAQCSCDFAANERKKMSEQFVRAGLGDSARQDATYDLLLAQYVKRHGSSAEIANFRLHNWLDPLLTFISAIAGVMVLIVTVERWRSRIAGNTKSSPKSLPRVHRTRKHR